MKNARHGIYAGKKFLFTHYDPSRHMAWSDDIGVHSDEGHVTWGLWVPYDSIQWC